MNPICHLGRFATLSAFGLALAALAGCEPATAPTTSAPTTTAPGEKPSNEIQSLPVEKKEGAAADVKLSDEELTAIKKLPAAEQPIALAQKVCPVSDAHLGAMDTPIKQTVAGKTFFLCCDSCVSEIKSNPAGVLAKLPK